MNQKIISNSDSFDGYKNPYIESNLTANYKKGNSHVSCFNLVEHFISARIISFNTMIRKNKIIIKDINPDQKFWLDSETIIHTYTLENIIHIKEGYLIGIYKDGVLLNNNSLVQSMMDLLQKQLPEVYNLWLYGQLLPYQHMEAGYLLWLQTKVEEAA